MRPSPCFTLHTRTRSSNRLKAMKCLFQLTDYMMNMRYQSPPLDQKIFLLGETNCWRYSQVNLSFCEKICPPLFFIIHLPLHSTIRLLTNNNSVKKPKQTRSLVHLCYFKLPRIIQSLNLMQSILRSIHFWNLIFH